MIVRNAPKSRTKSLYGAAGSWRQWKAVCSLQAHTCNLAAVEEKVGHVRGAPETEWAILPRKRSSYTIKRER